MSTQTVRRCGRRFGDSRATWRIISNAKVSRSSASADGHAALRRARGAADLLVLDIGLPGVDGYDVMRTLRREERNVPIVVLTARSDEIDRVLGFELGADDYI